MKVLKFGGTSVGTFERVRNVADIVIDAFSDHQQGVCLVVSAVGGITDKLLDCARTAEFEELALGKL